MLYDFLIDYCYIGTFLLMLIENLFPPIPSEVILLFSGFLVNSQNLNILLMIIASTIGCLLGAIILYFVGNKIKLKNTDKAIAFFEKNGVKTVFIARFIPLIRSVISIPAGTFKMPFRQFLLYTFWGSLIWNTVLIFLGFILKENFEKVNDFLKSYYLWIILGVFILYSLKYLKKKK